MKADPNGLPPRPVKPGLSPPIAAAAISGSAAVVLAAVLGVAAFTGTQEGTVLHAYYDGGKVPTICQGHTKGVKITDTATPVQCHAFYVADMTDAMKGALSVTPGLARQPGPLKASGDMVFNGGLGHYSSSPMAAAFAKGSWIAGCNAFVGYLTLYKAPKPVPGHRCTKNSKGVLYCEAGGLVTRRKGEAALCLKGIAA